MAIASSSQILIFTQQFSSMIKSKLQLVDVLENLARETPQKKFRDVIEEVSSDVQHGMDLGDALSEQRRVFNDIYINVVRAGMASGRLDEALAQIADYLKVVDEVKRRVRSAMSYPLFMLVAFFLVFNGMVFFILPRFSKMFANFGRELPYATQILITVGDVWASYWYLFIGGVFGTIVLFAIWVSTSDGRAIWDEIKLKLPFLGGIWRMSALSRFLRTLSVQVQNEVMLLDAIILSADSCDNIFIRDSLYNIAEEIEQGEGLAASFRRHDIFQGIVLQMISAGEEAGKLDELLLSSADYFESLLHDRLDMVTDLINPILTVFVGLGVAGMMVASFLPVFQMGGGCWLKNRQSKGSR